jgi:dTDP-4-dehydrorhamnose reductase
MLGTALVKVLSLENHEVFEFNREGRPISRGNFAFALDASKVDLDLHSLFAKHELDYLVNAIGVIRQLIIDSDKSSVANAQMVNSEFPKRLNNFSTLYNLPVIQIGTDCVFSGKKGWYDESQVFDPIDVYGETKLQGELNSNGAMTIRTSIIGKEFASNNSLLNWVLSRPMNSEILGYTNHFWNGVTTLAFAQVVGGIIRNSAFKPGRIHLVPQDYFNKRDLVSLIASTFKRDDLVIRDYATEVSINRTLTTRYTATNSQLWSYAGYSNVPSITRLVSDLAQWE